MTVQMNEDLWLDERGQAVPPGSPKAARRVAPAGARVSDEQARAWGLVNGRAPRAKGRRQPPSDKAVHGADENKGGSDATPETGED